MTVPNCTSCGRAMRPHAVPASRFPKLTSAGAKGKCSGCYAREDVRPEKRAARKAARNARRNARRKVDPALARAARAEAAKDRAEAAKDRAEAAKDRAERLRLAAIRDDVAADQRLAQDCPQFFQYLTGRRKRGIPVEGLPFALWPANLRLPQEATV